MEAMILTVSELLSQLPARGALIGLDVGTKRIGVATSDPDRRLASPVETITRRTFAVDAARILALVAERKAVGFILGLPINMDGSEGPRAQSTRAFARNLARLTELPIAFWDERLSTAAASRRSGSLAATPIVLVPRSRPINAPRAGRCAAASARGRISAGIDHG